MFVYANAYVIAYFDASRCFPSSFTMKRTALDNAGNLLKRHKSESPPSSDPFEPHLQKTARDVCMNGTDGIGFIAGKAFMVWSGERRVVRQVLMQVEEHGCIEQFDIKLSGRCKKYFDRLDFSAHDLFEISLKGAELEKKPESSKPRYLPMVLTFNQGVVIKFTKRARKPTENGLVVDTWKCAYY